MNSKYKNYPSPSLRLLLTQEKDEQKKEQIREILIERGDFFNDDIQDQSGTISSSGGSSEVQEENSKINQEFPDEDLEGVEQFLELYQDTSESDPDPGNSKPTREPEQEPEEISSDPVPGTHEEKIENVSDEDEVPEKSQKKIGSISSNLVMYDQEEIQKFREGVLQKLDKQNSDLDLTVETQQFIHDIVTTFDTYCQSVWRKSLQEAMTQILSLKISPDDLLKGVPNSRKSKKSPGARSDNRGKFHTIKTNKDPRTGRIPYKINEKVHVLDKEGFAVDSGTIVSFHYYESKPSSVYAKLKLKGSGKVRQLSISRLKSTQ